MSDDAARHHVGAVADPRRVVADRRGGNTELPQVVETGNPGAVAADPGIVEDRRRRAELRREIGGVDPAMRGVDDDRAARPVSPTRVMLSATMIGAGEAGIGGLKTTDRHEIASSPRSSQ
jgi:hypothetical protein